MTIDLIKFYVFSFTTIFTLVNPVGITPIFLGLTNRYSPEERKQIAKKGALTSAAVLILFGIVGTYIFQLYSITLDAFRIMGGIIFFRSGLRMLESKTPRARTSPEEQLESHHDLAISPIGVPLLAGPGAITGVMILTGQVTGIIQYSILLVSILLATTAAYLILRTADRFSYKLGISGLRLIQRLMAIILMAIATQFIINGVTGTFKIILQ